MIAYWSRVLKSAERNYSPTEREALALKESLVKFQAYVEGEKLLAITDHAALTWSRTYQNVNRRLLAWGTVFAAYPYMEIVHRAGRVHSNVDPVSRLRRRMPQQDGPVLDDQISLQLSTADSAMTATYESVHAGFEERVLKQMDRISSLHKDKKLKQHTKIIKLEEEPSSPATTLQLQTYTTTTQQITIAAVSQDEIKDLIKGYQQDPHYSLVMSSLTSEEDWSRPRYPHYQIGEDGLIYFLDAEDRGRLCIPKSERNKILSALHNLPSEGAHAGRYRTYNRIAALYYWPRMSIDVRNFVRSCDLCQKIKPRRHAPAGLLQPITIPSYPFEVISMDFITDLPPSGDFTAILVIIDKLTKYGMFIPTVKNINEIETAKLFFESVYPNFGIPRQIISDRDPRWTGAFWKELVMLIGSRRALTTAHHPQADGQTENLNQTLEIALRAYINKAKDNWVDYLSSFKRSYNTGIHASIGMAPAYALYGFEPPGPEGLIVTGTKAIPRKTLEAPQALDLAEEWDAMRSTAKDSLKLAQSHQMRNYNKGRPLIEFHEGDLVLINPHTLELRTDTKGIGRKLLARYEGPFEILEKISPITYRLKLRASYKIHPVISIAHLEKYHTSTPDLGDRTVRDFSRKNFDQLQEWEVESIVGERMDKGKKGRAIRKYCVRFSGFGPEDDQWLTGRQLTNAPECLRAWKREKTTQKVSDTHSKNLEEALESGHKSSKDTVTLGRLSKQTGSLEEKEPGLDSVDPGLEPSPDSKSKRHLAQTKGEGKVSVKNSHHPGNIPVRTRHPQSGLHPKASLNHRTSGSEELLDSSGSKEEPYPETRRSRRIAKMIPAENRLNSGRNLMRPK